MIPTSRNARRTSIHIARFGGAFALPPSCGICVASGGETLIGGMTGIWGRPDCGTCGIARGRPGSAGTDIMRVYSLGSYGEPEGTGGTLLGIANACVAPPPPDKFAGGCGASGGLDFGNAEENGAAEGNCGPEPAPAPGWKNFENSLAGGACRSGPGFTGGGGD